MIYDSRQRKPATQEENSQQAALQNSTQAAVTVSSLH